MSKPITFSRRSVLAMPLALAACYSKSSVLEFSGLTMGTTYSVIAVDPSGAVNPAKVQTAIDAALASVNASMSNWDPNSEISRFNAQRTTDPMQVSPDLATVMQAAATVNTESAGRFDTTMGPLIELWGFGAEGRYDRAPETAAIHQARLSAGHGNSLIVNGTHLQKRLPDAQIYLAAIGKGFGADKIGATLSAFGLKDYMVEIGGDLLTAGLNPDGQPWQIGIETPQAMARGVYDVVGLSGYGLATSGDYRNYFEQDGTRYSHVIDPATGYPIDHATASVTVIAENAMLADGWATAMMTLGSEMGGKIAEERGLAVMFLDHDGAGAGFTARKSTLFNALTA